MLLRRGSGPRRGSRFIASTGDAWGIANSLWSLGYAVAEEGDWAEAQQLVEESVRLFRELGDQHYLLLATRTLAWTHEELGDLECSRALHEENLRRARALNRTQVEAITLGALAMIAVDQNRIQDALSLLKENVSIYHDLGDPLGTATNLSRVAHALALAGRPAPAVRLLSHAQTLADEIGASVPWVARMNEETLAVIHTQLDDAAFAEAWEHGRKLSPDEAVALAVDSVG
ncbi:MAG: tetratricopeptide repeat protein [Gaiellaceae bacterium]